MPNYEADTGRAPVAWTEKNAEKVLLQALQLGQIIARVRSNDGGSIEMAPAEWSHASGRGWPRSISLPRATVVARWPIKTSEANAGPPDSALQRSKVTRQPGRELARQALASLYPNGVPDAVKLPNNALQKQVGAWLKDQGLRDVGDDTILRAALRRK
jgi:hypothetical protein